MLKSRSFTSIFVAGVILFSSLPALGQERLASIEKLRSDYQSFLAVERDPSAATEVKDLNRGFLEERRAQLRAALHKRIGALRAYLSSKTGALTAVEGGAIEASIRRLEDEMEGIERDAARKEASAPATRARQTVARVEAKSTTTPPALQASFAPDSATNGPAPAIAPPAAPPQADQAIAIISPADNTTVSTNQIEIVVALRDPDVAKLMVAIYTALSGDKPLTARVYDLYRRDRDQKSIVIGLREGLNRIEVSDSARPDIKAEVNIRYVRDADILGAVQPRPPRFAEGDTVLCGQLQLASLNQTLALIKATPELSDLAQRFRDPGDALVKSTLGDQCQELGGRDGTQKMAVVDVLKAVLLRLEPDLEPRELLINQRARENIVGRLLTETSGGGLGLDRNALENDIKILAGGAASRGGGVTRGEVTEDRIIRGSEFSSLPAATIRKQILLLEQYLGNVTVQLKNNNGDVIDQVTTDRDGNFLFIIQKATPPPPPPATPTPLPTPTEYTISTEADQYYTTRTMMIRPGAQERLNILIEDKPVSLLARALVGYDQAGAAAAKSQQTFFFNLYLNNSFPFKQKVNPDFGENLRLWGDFRINSVPQTGDSTISDFAGGGFATQISGLKVNEAAQVFEFLGGLEYRLTGNNALLPSFDRRTRQKFALSLIGGFGSVTPLDSQAGVTVFRVFDDAPGLPPAARGKEFIAFARTDRDRFFRQYYAGVRINTFFFNNYNVPIQRFPAQLDVLVGQNEFVTGGKLAGPVFRFDGFFPLPYEDLKYINLYASAILRPGGAQTSTPLILQPAPDGTIVPGANVALFALPQPSRDYYRIGFGVDFVSLADKILKARTNK